MNESNKGPNGKLKWDRRQCQAKVVDEGRHEVTRRGDNFPLTAREFELLAMARTTSAFNPITMSKILRRVRTLDILIVPLGSMDLR
jgi:DNA-binding response OmpR family regulator